MAIRRLKVSNFRSFNELDVELGDFNVLIGANASGKSNFVAIFRFLRDIATSGLDDAISLQGGAEYLLNAQSEERIPLAVSISADATGDYVFAGLNGEEAQDDCRYYVAVRKVDYSFALDFSGAGQPEIREDKLDLTCEFTREPKESAEEPGTANSRYSGVISLTAKDGLPVFTTSIPLITLFDGFKEISQSVFTALRKHSVSETAPSALLLEKAFFYIPIFADASRAFTGSNIAFHTFNSQLARKPSEVGAKAGLAEDGSNLALVLRKIFADSEEKRRFLLHYRDILPFVADVDVETLDRSLLIMFRETYTPDRMFPSTFAADGTMDAAALVAALYFQERAVVIIEEPERHLHPNLIAKLVAMLEDVLEHKQIIVTTHNPELVKHSRREDILLVSRDTDGHSKISRPAEREHVQVFLENDLGIEDLYVDNLLEG